MHARRPARRRSPQSSRAVEAHGVDVLRILAAAVRVGVGEDAAPGARARSRRAAARVAPGRRVCPAGCEVARAHARRRRRKRGARARARARRAAARRRGAAARERRGWRRPPARAPRARRREHAALEQPPRAREPAPVVAGRQVARPGRGARSRAGTRRCCRAASPRERDHAEARAPPSARGRPARPARPRRGRSRACRPCRGCRSRGGSSAVTHRAGVELATPRRGRDGEAHRPPLSEALLAGSGTGVISASGPMAEMLH